ncbi:squalene/phytoene synthase family protein [Chloroflexota bacterium]
MARSITWAGSKQTFFTARLLVDMGLVDDFYRAYAYFRWVDDVIDMSSQPNDELISFIRWQKELIDRLYNNERLDDLAPEEKMVVDLISHDRGDGSGLQSFIRNMLASIEFDALRRGRLISQQELKWYSECVGKSVTDGIQYFIGNGHSYPVSDSRYMAAIGAHLSHLLRDMVDDIASGFVNIPYEYLEAHGISPENLDSAPLRDWVRGQVEQARQYFRDGKCYLSKLNVLRCKIAGYWYCARFEGILDTIECDEYALRDSYNERRKLYTYLNIFWLGVTVTLHHIVHRARRKS